MDKEKLQKIIDSVYRSTINKTLTWSLSNSCFNSDTSHQYECPSSDGLTIFSCTVSLEKNLKLKTTKYDLMYIKNSGVVDGGVYLYSNEYAGISELHKWLYDTYILAKTKLIADQDNVMDGILNGISVADDRDKKIEDVLGSKQKTIQVPGPRDFDTHKKTIIDKILGR